MSIVRKIILASFVLAVVLVVADAAPGYVSHIYSHIYYFFRILRCSCTHEMYYTRAEKSPIITRTFTSNISISHQRSHLAPRRQLNCIIFATYITTAALLSFTFTLYDGSVELSGALAAGNSWEKRNVMSGFDWLLTFDEMGCNDVIMSQVAT